MKISIITATYNREKLLSRLYKSLCEQTCKDFEWIVIDDGSVDDFDDFDEAEDEANAPEEEAEPSGEDLVGLDEDLGELSDALDLDIDKNLD